MKKGLWWLVIGLCLFLSSWWILNGNLMFHTDVGRDMYLLKDITDNKHLTLIGPRSSLPGLFHGPLWIYLNLPIYIVGQGNPLFLSIFWLGLLVFGWWLLYETGKRITEKETAMVATLLLAGVTILNSHVMISFYAAVTIFPIFYYCFWKYIITDKTKYLAWGLIVGGVMVQSQIVFGLPMLAMLTVWSIFRVIKTNKWRKIWVYLLTLIPFSSYILFDLRHNFIQGKAILGMISGGGEFKSKGWINLVDWWKVVAGNDFLALVVFGLVLWVSFIKYTKEKNSKDAWWFLGGSIIVLWVAMMTFRIGSVDFYYLPLISAMVMMVASLKKYLNKIIYGLLIGLLLLTNISKAMKDTINYSKDVNFQDQATWQSNYEAAKWLFDHCGNNFGYFVYSSDLYGYSLRYAIDFLKIKTKINANLNKKLPTTCLVMGPNSKENNWSRENWKDSDIKIYKIPTESKLFGNGILMEKYDLTNEEQKVEPNPLLIKDIIFR